MAGRSVVVGVDLGGTKILSAVFDDDLRKIARKKTKTAAVNGSDAVLDNVSLSVAGALDKAKIPMADVDAIGVAVPGVFDRSTGVIIQTPNLPLSDYPLKAALEQHFSRPVWVENDVNAGTYGEYRAGAAKGYRHVLGVFPGTGIGGGLIINGELYIGSGGNAGEIGHMIIQPGGPLCGCGRRGCLEAFAGRSAMARDAVFLANSGAAPDTLAAAGTDYSAYTSKVFHRAIEAGEAAIVGVIERAAWYLGIGLANCVNLLNPEIVVVGGGLVERLGDRYLRVVEQSMRDHAMRGLADHVAVVAASLGDDATVVGAAALAAERSRA